LGRPFSIAWCRLGHKVWYPKCHKSLHLTWAGEPAPSWVGSGTMQDPPPATVRPSALLVLVALVAAQGIGLVGLAVFFLVELLVSTPTSAARAVVAALLTLLAGLGLLAVARGLARAR